MPGKTYYGSGTKLTPDEHGQKTLLAYSLSEGKLAWRYPQVGRGDSWGGTLATAGGLVFFGDDAGSLEAVVGRTGRALWHFNTGQIMHASPMSYMVDGVQYVAVSAGTDVFSFSLPH
jgi:alcohol dehydrogenase (cytochrome c)